MTATVRHATEAELKVAFAAIPALAGVRVIATEKQLDEVTQPTALLRVKSTARSREAPNSHRDVGLLLTLISQYEDEDNAQDELDVLTDAALDYLDPNWRHGDAQNVSYGGTRLAVDIPITALAKRT